MVSFHAKWCGQPLETIWRKRKELTFWKQYGIASIPTPIMLFAKFMVYPIVVPLIIFWRFDHVGDKWNDYFYTVEIIRFDETESIEWPKSRWRMQRNAKNHFCQIVLHTRNLHSQMRRHIADSKSEYTSFLLLLLFFFQLTITYGTWTAAPAIRLYFKSKTNIFIPIKQHIGKVLFLYRFMCVASVFCSFVCLSSKKKMRYHTTMAVASATLMSEKNELKFYRFYYSR